MTWEDEIRLLGQPFKLTLPGDEGEEYKPLHYRREKFPLLAGKTYYGYCIDEDKNMPASRNVYLEIDNKLVSLCDFDIEKARPIIDHITWIQRQFSIENLYEILNMFNQKINEIDQRLYEKADR